MNCVFKTLNLTVFHLLFVCKSHENFFFHIPSYPKKKSKLKGKSDLRLQTLIIIVIYYAIHGKKRERERERERECVISHVEGKLDWIRLNELCIHNSQPYLPH